MVKLYTEWYETHCFESFRGFFWITCIERNKDYNLKRKMCDYHIFFKNGPCRHYERNCIESIKNKNKWKLKYIALTE